MKLTKNIMLKTSGNIVGDEGNLVVEYLMGKANISEFKIAEDLDVDVHFVRNVLYRLNNSNLATYIRKKDRIKGWYISYWTLNPRRFREVYLKQQQDRLDTLKEKLKKEQEYRDGLFICPNLCSRMNFDNAMENNFKCPECGRIMHQQDNTKTIENLKSMIEEIEAAA